MPDTPAAGRWYEGVTRYQWMVLAIASAGWVFDVFEGQIFVASMRRAMPELLGPTATAADVRFYNSVANFSFLLGGAVGGVLFGILADRIGRRRVMTYTILMYSLFTGLTYFAETWYHLVLLRFLVAMGVGGEWAVAAAIVAEGFPPRARAVASGIFHASSVLGTYLAIAAGATVVVLNWRYGFLLGILPALLILWVRVSLKESESWEADRRRQREEGKPATGGLKEVWSTPLYRRHVILGTLLAAVGLATFWGVHIYGKDLLAREREDAFVAEAKAQQFPEREPRADELKELRTKVQKSRADDLQQWEMLGMLLVTTGGGIGLLCFAPLSERTNRRTAFLILHIGAVAVVLVTAQFVHGFVPLLLILPLFGFFTLGMHAGYAVYFPELFPTRLRGTGGGFCFNVGRILAGPVLLWGAALHYPPFDLDIRDSMSLMALLFLGGAALLWFLPETKGQPLPE